MIRGTSIRELSRPDAGEFPWDRESVCVLSSDDAGLAAALEKRLSSRGWRVVIQTSPEGLDVDGLVARFGRIGAWISVAPRTRLPSSGSTAAALLGNDDEEAWLFSQFRFARQLSPHLNSPGPSRTWFVAVTRLDGRLGFAPAPQPTSVVAAGVYGLVKTLRLEWPAVFCRAIDLHPGIDAAFAAERIVEELHDPDHGLGEVGHGFDGRSTIAVFEATDG